MFLCKADIHNPLRYLLMNARETWQAILVSFADIYLTESLASCTPFQSDKIPFVLAFYVYCIAMKN